MNCQVLPRSLPRTLPRALPLKHIRHESSARRTRKALRVKPNPSFTTTDPSETRDHIIFNPPSSAPNVYHTPAKFLPLNDPRRKAVHASSASPSSTLAVSRPPSIKALPPPVRPVQEKKYHLTPAQVDEMRRLRAEDPRAWTRVRLAEKFECSQFFVSLCCSATEIKAERSKELEQIKLKWGRRKTEAREDRQRRKEGWGRDS